MKRARMALWSIVLCMAIALLSENMLFTHPAFAASTSGTGSPHSATACLQPPTNVDHATLSDADLARYGLPRYQPGKSKAAWQDAVRAMKHRACVGTPTHFSNTLSTSMHPTQQLTPRTPSCSPYNLVGANIWSGNITVNSATDGSCTQNNTYTEADAVFYVPCIKSGSPTGVESSWVGLGGWYDNNLVQAGSHSEVSYFLGIPFYTYYAWTQNLAASNTETRWFDVNCNDRMQVFVYHSGEMYIIDHNSGNYKDIGSSPDASYNTAEWIVERPSTCNGNTCTPGPLADFQSDTFYGMGTTVGSGYCNNCYVSPHDVDHDYSNMTGRTNIGSLVYNTAWGPPDYANTLTWVHQ